MKHCRPIVLFEPIARGSRLHILANMVTAIRTKSNRKIIIITRQDYSDHHFNELIKGDFYNIEIVSPSTDLNGAWIKTLDTREFSTCLETLYDTISKESCDVVFMALDEYLLPFSLHSIQIRRRLRYCRVWVIKYRVGYLLRYTSDLLRSIVLDFLTHWCLLVGRARLICFDERLSGRTLSDHPISVIPDPWFGDFDPAWRTQGRALYGFTDQDFVILTLGRQDRRKGIHMIIAAAADLMAVPGALLFIVGKIDSDFESVFSRFVDMYGDRVKHIAKFVDDTELPNIFASADVFLLPYSQDFTSTSGTLPRAAASGVPVVTGIHGLVGHRVRQQGLGETFHIDDLAGFVDAVRHVKNYSEQKRSQVRSSLLQFAEDSTLSRFENKVSSLIL